MGAVRTQLSLPAVLREMAICAVATLNHAPCEIDHHAPVLLALGGSAAQIEALLDVDTACDRDDLLEPAQRATLRLALEMTREVRVADSTFLEVRCALGDDRQVVELVATIAAYNVVSRVIAALGIELE